MNERKEKREIKINLPLLILIMLLIIIGAVFGIKAFYNNDEHQLVENPNGVVSDDESDKDNEINNSTDENQNTENDNVVEENKNEDSKPNDGEVLSKEVSKFDLSFLKLENQKENKIYSPLSIKYALKMLEEGASGESKEQITNVIGNRNLTKYSSNNNMSLANALFVKNSFVDGIKEEYKNVLKTKYDAEVINDSFETPDNVNSWISEKTLNLINNLLAEIDESTNFILVNALGIDMEWNKKFLSDFEDSYYEYRNEKLGCDHPIQVTSHEFDSKKQIVSGMKIEAVVNNYDIVKELGEDKIKETVIDEYVKWYEEEYGNIKSEEEVLKDAEKYFEEGYGEGNYIDILNSNYKLAHSSTDFLLHVDDDIKVFAKDLKEYEGTTLQYVGIMPVEEELENYVGKIDEKEIDNIINNLKELKSENFKEGVATKIVGFIPKFKFNYELALKEDLNKLGINDVFSAEKAQLTQMSDLEGVFINDAKHKADIEFTQDGIKAAAVTLIGGAGGGGEFEYDFDVPVEEIDLTFDKPYMFLIRDKETGEIWFVGTVYEPLLWENEPEKDASSSI